MAESAEKEVDIPNASSVGAIKLSEKEALSIRLSSACHLTENFELLAEPKSL